MSEWTTRLGWFVRRAADPEQLGAFYEQVVGLPVLRRYGATRMLWSGETTCLEIAEGGTVPPRYTDRAQAPCFPIFRVHDIDGEIDRLRGAGVEQINDIQGDYRLAYFLDPVGHVFGIQRRPNPSDRSEDIDALRRWESGAWRLAGAGDLPPSWQYLGWVVIRGTDTPKLIAFFRDVLGLPLKYGHGDVGLLALDELCLLEIAPGGEAQPIAADRGEVSNAFILRTTGMPALVQHLKAAGVHFVNDPFDIDGGTIAYFLDPENHVIGIQERWPTSTRIEDQEATRRRNGE
jgi:predicted enzyme related to lactoylglutathione lyase